MKIMRNVFLFLFAATLFLELWKRYSTVLVHNWGLSNYSRRGEHPRPQYLSKLKNVKTTRVNAETLMKEPFLPYWRSRFPRYCLSYITIIFLVSINFSFFVPILIIHSFGMREDYTPRSIQKVDSITIQPFLHNLTDLLITVCHGQHHHISYVNNTGPTLLWKKTFNDL